MATLDDSDAVQPAPPPKNLGVELGVGTIFPNSIWFNPNDPNGSTVINKPVVTIDQLVDMRRRDGQAKALIQLVTLPLRLALQSGEWVSPEDDEEEAAEEVEFANQLWSLPPMAGGMTTPKSKLIRQILLGLVDGFAAFETVHRYVEDGPMKGKYAPQKLAYRDPRTIKFKVDDKGGFNGFQQVTHDFDGNPVDVYIGRQEAWVFTMHDEYNPFYGVSLFESAYPHFDTKKKLYYIAHMAAQFAAVPGRVGYAPLGAKPTDVSAFLKAMANFAFNGSMVAWENYKVEPFEGNSGFDFLALIDHHNQQMSKSILAPFFDQENRTVLIENNAQNDSDADLFLQCMVSIADNIAENLSHYLIPKYIDWNFGSKRYPVFKPGQLSDSAKKAVIQLFNTLVSASTINATPELLREMEKKVSADVLGLDIDYEEIAEKEAEAAEEAQRQQQEQVKQEQEMAKVEAQTQLEAAKAAARAPVAAPRGAPGARPAARPVRLSAEEEEGALGIDELVQAAQDLFVVRPDDTTGETKIDEGL